MLSRVSSLLVLSLPLLVLSGCVGSNAPYRPGFEPRPTQVPVETEVERVRRQTVPVEIARNDARLIAGRKEVARILGDVPPQPWNAYRDEMKSTLGEHAGAHLSAAPEGDAAGAPAGEAAEESGGGDEWGDDSGDDEWGDDSGDDEWGDDSGGDEWGDDDSGW